MYRSCVGYEEVGGRLRPQFDVDAAACLAGVIVLGLAAWLLARSADRRFDRAVDRPRRPA